MKTASTSNEEKRDMPTAGLLAAFRDAIREQAESIGAYRNTVSGPQEDELWRREVLLRDWMAIIKRVETKVTANTKGQPCENRIGNGRVFPSQ
jgi:hypothetical protein